MSYYEDIFSPEDVCFTTAAKKQCTSTLTAMKRANSANFYTETRAFKNMWKGHYLNNITTSYYKTNGQSGSHIIHAISGESLVGIVGRKEEDRYFKVKVSLGGDASGTLFYLSPEEYENHHYCEVSQKTKLHWLSKRQQMQMQ